DRVRRNHDLEASETLEDSVELVGCRSLLAAVPKNLAKECARARGRIDDSDRAGRKRVSTGSRLADDTVGNGDHVTNNGVRSVVHPAITSLVGVVGGQEWLVEVNDRIGAQRMVEIDRLTENEVDVSAVQQRSDIVKQPRQLHLEPGL